MSRVPTVLQAIERLATGSERPYATILPGREIDPRVGTSLRAHLKLGAGVGSVSAGLAVCWLFVVGLFTGADMNGAGVIVLVIPVAAICGALAGVVTAVPLGIVLWPTLALPLARYAYPIAATVIQGWIMWAYGIDAFDTSVRAPIVGVGAAVIAAVVASRWTAAMLVEFSRHQPSDPTGTA